jgi:hypothetical protein
LVCADDLAHRTDARTRETWKLEWVEECPGLGIYELLPPGGARPDDADVGNGQLDRTDDGLVANSLVDLTPGAREGAEQRLQEEERVHRGKLFCWPWSGATGPTGYGRLQVVSRGRTLTFSAHRAMYEYTHGTRIPPRMVVRHTCHNPICVQPGHLIVGTHQDNMDDKRVAGRDRRSRLEDD